jgi:hypothetical protein
MWDEVDVGRRKRKRCRWCSSGGYEDSVLPLLA